MLFKAAAVLLNLSVMAYLVKVMLRHYQSNYDLRSWAALFHSTSLVWLTMRCVFWLCTLWPAMAWTEFSFYLLYWVPTTFEFSAYVLLPLFFAQVLYPAKWSDYWPCVRPMYFGTIAAIILFEIAWSFYLDHNYHKPCLNGHAKDCFHTESASEMFRFITFVCFLFVSIIQCAFGFKILRMDDQAYQRVLILPRRTMAIVNALLVICFATRALYQLCALYALYILPDIPLEASQGDISFSVLAATLLWMFLPSTLIVSTITSRSFGQQRNSPPQTKNAANYFGKYGSLADDDRLLNPIDDIGEEDEEEGAEEMHDHFQDFNTFTAPLRDISREIPILSSSSKRSSAYSNFSASVGSGSSDGLSFSRSLTVSGSGSLGQSVTLLQSYRHLCPQQSTAAQGTEESQRGDIASPSLCAKSVSSRGRSPHRAMRFYDKRTRSGSESLRDARTQHARSLSLGQWDEPGRMSEREGVAMRTSGSVSDAENGSLFSLRVSSDSETNNEKQQSDHRESDIDERHDNPPLSPNSLTAVHGERKKEDRPGEREVTEALQMHIHLSITPTVATVQNETDREIARQRESEQLYELMVEPTPSPSVSASPAYSDGSSESLAAENTSSHRYRSRSYISPPPPPLSLSLSVSISSSQSQSLEREREREMQRSTSEERPRFTQRETPGPTLVRVPLPQRVSMLSRALSISVSSSSASSSAHSSATASHSNLQALAVPSAQRPSLSPHWQYAHSWSPSPLYSPSPSSIAGHTQTRTRASTVSASPTVFPATGSQSPHLSHSLSSPSCMHSHQRVLAAGRRETVTHTRHLRETLQRGSDYHGQFSPQDDSRHRFDENALS